MRFTILSHAGMLVETLGVKLLTDPWLLGSCYWRSWWNYPRPVLPPGLLDNLDYIYITHHHWDHFHGPSLRKLPRNVTVMVPSAQSTFLIDDLAGFGFKEIVEMPHGKEFTLGSGLRLTSYHFGIFPDSTLVIDDGDSVIVNMNDCKITGLPLRQLLRRHPRVDFLLRSHSSASPYPHCVEAEDPQDLQYRSNEDYMTEFVRAAELVKPRYAIPFASNHCFMHRETIRYNDTIVSPVDVQEYFGHHKPEGSECVVMLPGDSWESRQGFRLHGLDPYTAREEYMEGYKAEVAPILEKHYRIEDKVTVSFPTFEAHFTTLLRSIPRISRAVFKPVIVFQLTSVSELSWVVDFNRRSVYETKGLPSGWSVVIQTHPAVLRDCLQKGMFTVFMPSKRMSVRLAKGNLRDLFVLNQVLEMREYGYLPLRKTINKRFLGAWLRRWREILHYARIILKVLLARNRGDRTSVLIPRIS